jgi:hypothetical protein
MCGFGVESYLLVRVFGRVETLIFLALDFGVSIGHDGSASCASGRQVSMYRWPR